MIHTLGALASHARGGGAGPTFLGAVAAGAASLSAPAVTAGVDTTGATFIAVASVGLGFPTLAAITDSKGNTWTARTAATVVSGYTYYSQIWYCYSPTVGAGHTFTATPSGSGIGVALAVAWFAGTASPYDTEAAGAANLSGGITSFQDGSVTPGHGSEVIISALMYNGTSTVTVDSGFTVGAQANPVGGSSLGVAIGYLIQGGAAAVNPTFSWTGASSAQALATATFQ